MENLNIKGKINEAENGQTIENNSETKSWFIERMNRNDKPL